MANNSLFSSLPSSPATPPPSFHPPPPVVKPAGPLVAPAQTAQVRGAPTHGGISPSNLPDDVTIIPKKFTIKRALKRGVCYGKQKVCGPQMKILWILAALLAIIYGIMSAVRLADRNAEIDKTEARKRKDAELAAIKLPTWNRSGEYPNRCVTPQGPDVGVVIHCHYLTALPEIGVRESAKTAYMFLNTFTELTERMFQEMPNLEKLHLGNSKIETINYEAFGGIEQLKYLNLSENLIETINTEVFKILINLETLLLENNRIINIAWETFQANVNLRELRLSHNALMTIDPSTFNHTTNLEELWLDNNKIEAIHPRLFANLRSLEVVHLEMNKIKRIEKKTFINANFENLNGYLNLSWNNLTRIINGAFSESAVLNTLDLSNNNLNCSLYTIFPNASRKLGISKKCEKTASKKSCNEVNCTVNKKCVKAANGAVCICIPGYSGKSCMTDIDECKRRNTCQRGAKCVNNNGSYTCLVIKRKAPTEDSAEEGILATVEEYKLEFGAAGLVIILLLGSFVYRSVTAANQDEDKMDEAEIPGEYGGKKSKKRFRKKLSKSRKSLKAKHSKRRPSRRRTGVRN